MSAVVPFIEESINAENGGAVSAATKNKAKSESVKVVVEVPSDAFYFIKFAQEAEGKSVEDFVLEAILREHEELRGKFFSMVADKKLKKVPSKKQKRLSQE